MGQVTGFVDRGECGLYETSPAALRVSSTLKVAAGAGDINGSERSPSAPEKQPVPRPGPTTVSGRSGSLSSHNSSA